MGELRINPVFGITNLVQRGGDRRAHAMLGEQVGIAHPMQCIVQRVLADSQL